MSVKSSDAAATRERQPFKIVDAFSESHKFAIAGLHCATLELVRDQPEPSGP
jgi:hypothetical protein